MFCIDLQLVEMVEWGGNWEVKPETLFRIKYPRITTARRPKKNHLYRS